MIEYEVSNFAERLENDGFTKMLTKNSCFLKSIKENYIKKDDLLDSQHVFKFGFHRHFINLDSQYKQC